MILAAGRGERLRPLSDTTPKPLIEMAGRPLIESHLEQCAQAGVTDIAVNLWHLGERIEAALGDGARWGLRIHYIHETELLGTGGGLANARPLLDDGEPFALMNGDTWMERDLAGWAEVQEAGNWTALLVVREAPEAEAYGTLGVDAQGRVVRILDWHAPDGGVEVRRVMFCGVHLLTPIIFDYLDAEPSCIMRTAYRRMLEGGLRIGAVAYAGPWFDIGTPERLEVARRALEGKTDG